MSIDYEGAPIEVTKCYYDHKDMLTADIKFLGSFPDGSGKKGDTKKGIRISQLNATAGLEEILNECSKHLNFKDRKENYAAHLPDAEGLRSTSLTDLVALFNRMAPQDKSIKKFADKATAIKRLTDIFTQESISTNTPPPTEKQRNKLVEKILNSEGSTPEVKKELKPVEGRSISLDLKIQSQTNLKQEVQSAASRNFFGKRIHLCVKENPRRTGTQGWHNWNLYHDGMPFEEYIASAKVKALNHFRWDIEKGFIKVS